MKYSIRRFLRLTRRKEARRLTFTGWLLLLCIAGFILFQMAFRLGDFLMLNRPVNARVMVIEGYLPDYALLLAIDDFQKGGYTYIVTTGIPFTTGAMHCEYKNYPDLCKATLVRLGIPACKVFSVPSAEAFRDRTFGSAMALRRWFVSRGERVPDFNLYSMGAHARRSHFLYRLAFKDLNTDIGVIAAPDLTFDSSRWWTSSKGFRTVPVEALGYFFVLLFFHP